MCLNSAEVFDQQAGFYLFIMYFLKYDYRGLFGSLHPNTLVNSIPKKKKKCWVEEFCTKSRSGKWATGWPCGCHYSTDGTFDWEAAIIQREKQYAQPR